MQPFRGSRHHLAQAFVALERAAVDVKGCVLGEKTYPGLDVVVIERKAVVHKKVGDSGVLVARRVPRGGHLSLSPLKWLSLPRSEIPAQAGGGRPLSMVLMVRP